MIARILPHPGARTRDLLVVDLADERLHAAIVRAGARDEVVAAAEVERTEDLAQDLASALATLRAEGARVPAQAVALTDAATAVCLDVPPTAELPAERVEGLVRWELEPLVPSAGPEGLACGWAAGAAAARTAGPLLACGLAARERDALAEAFRRAGLRLSGIYPRLGCAMAMAPVDLPARAVVAELAPGRVGLAWLEGGRVTRLSVTRAASDAALADAVLAAAPTDDVPLLVVGAASDAVRAALEATRAAVTFLPCAGPASLLGAARHALALPGSERVAGVPGQAPAPPLLARGAVRAALAGALVLLAVAGADVALGNRARRLGEQVARREGEARTARLAAAAAAELVRERDAAAQEAATLRAAAERTAARERRAGELVALLDALAAAPEGVVLEGLEDRTAGAGGRAGLTVRGEALDPAAAQAFLRDLAAALAPRGLTLVERQVVRAPTTRFGVDGFRFEARLAGAAPPKAGGRRP